MKRFALIGASGYIAPRHVEAIKYTNNDLVACLDPYDGIGYMDKHFPNSSYFKEAERFDRHLDRLRRKGKTIALESANKNYETKIFGPDRVKVQGVLVSLYRNF